MRKYSYEIQSSWGRCPEKPAEIGTKFLQTIDALSRIDPMFSGWGVQIKPDSLEGQPIENVRADFTRFVEANVWRDDLDRPTPHEGYKLLAATNFHTEDPSKSLALSVRAGSVYGNKNSLQAGSGSSPPDSKLITYPVFKAALLTMLSSWPASWANVRVSLWGHRPEGPPGEPPFPYSGYQMPWMAYLCAERAAHISLPPGIPSERTPDGGLLMIAAKTRFDPSDREHMARSRVLAEILIKHGGDPDAL